MSNTNSCSAILTLRFFNCSADTLFPYLSLGYILINRSSSKLYKTSFFSNFEYFLEKMKYADEQKRKELVSLVRKIWDYLFVDDIYYSDSNSNKIELKEHDKEDPDVMEFLHFALKELYKTI